jgi:hypothetical protein
MAKLIIKLIGTLIVSTILCLFVYPEAGKNYEGFLLGWFAACVHGGTFIINYLISLYDESRLVKATLYSGAYNFWWWVSAISSVSSIFFQLLGVLLNLIKTKKS